MSVKTNCFARGHRLLRFYQYLYEISDELNRVPASLRPNAIIGSIKELDLELLVKGEIESLFRTGVISEKDYHNFKTRVESMKQGLPSHIEPETPESDIESKLDYSSKELDTLLYEVENTLYQEVARCEGGQSS